jgi:endonuclease/exonuclease/phosphatase family metal-dependent hydrolase
MSVRVATFNVENLMSRFDFSGFRNELNQDRVLSLYTIRDEAEYRMLESARTVAHTDDGRQLSALAIASTRADILCLQEVDDIEALKAFEYGYLFKMVGHGYRNKYISMGNDSRGIDVAVIVREETRDGEPIEFVRMQSHAPLTFGELDLGPELIEQARAQPTDRVFRRDCLEVDLRIAGRPLTIYNVHFKSMGGPRNGMDGRQATMAIRLAESRAVRRIIEQRFGGARAGGKRWLVCGDLNDYGERIVVEGGYGDQPVFTHVVESASGIDPLLADGFTENVASRLPPLERWTLYHTRGPAEQHLCQLDYILLSPHLARTNAHALPEIVRAGQPWRTPLPPGQEVERFPRTGWDRPKASDHCPIAITLDML